MCWARFNTFTFKLVTTNTQITIAYSCPASVFWPPPTYDGSEFNMSSSAQPPYNEHEKQWLKENFGNEFKFLRTHGLSIYKEDERAEGRAMAREMMRRDDEGEDDGDDFEAELERNSNAHFADHHFSGPELDWIEGNYGNSENFLLSYGLKFYKDEDCREGKQILRQLVAHGGR